jgi:hypothetical protein
MRTGLGGRDANVREWDRDLEHAIFECEAVWTRRPQRRLRVVKANAGQARQCSARSAEARVLVTELECSERSAGISVLTQHAGAHAETKSVVRAPGTAWRQQNTPRHVLDA